MKEREYRSELFETHNIIKLSDTWISNYIFNSYITSIAEKFNSYKANRQNTQKFGKVKTKSYKNRLSDGLLNQLVCS